ncbi:MAG: hypothetical protein M3247_08550 [Thermoproteota archaeon]|nr:hypothetical protein [Thermoproteota archaeon]
MSNQNVTLEYLGRELVKIDSSDLSGAISFPSLEQLRERAMTFIKEQWPTILDSSCSAWENADKQKRKEAIEKAVRSVADKLPPPYNIISVAAPIVTYLIDQNITYLCRHRPQDPPPIVSS